MVLRRLPFWFIAVLTGIGFAAFATSAKAGMRILAAVAPIQAVEALKPDFSNGDHLRIVQAPPAEKTLKDVIFDEAMTRELKARYEPIIRQYETEQPYHLRERETYNRFESQNKGLADWTMNRLLQYHVDTTLEGNLEKAAKRALDDSQRRTSRKSKTTANQKSDGDAKAQAGVAQTVVTITKIQRALRNTTIDLGNDYKTHFRYDMPSGNARMGLTSPLVNADFNYFFPPLRLSGPGAAPSERATMSMTKSLDFAKASTSIRYGLITETLNYGLNKQIAGPLSASVDQAHYVKESNRDETTFRLNFGTAF